MPTVQQFIERVIAAAGQQGLSPSLTTDPVRAAQIVGVLQPIAESGRLSIEWAVINGRRVDVGATSGESEWRVVMSIDAAGVHSASVWARPEAFPGVAGGRAVIVNGPSSAGKSTVMAAVVDQATTPWVMFDEISFGSLKAEYLIWRDTTPTLTAGFVAGITALAAAGNQVVLTGVLGELLDPLRAAVPTLCVGLDCPVDVLIARQSERSDRWGGLTESSQDVHDGWHYDLRFDTSRTGPNEVAAAILDAVAAPPFL